MNDKRTIAWFSAFVIVVMLIGVASGVLLDRFLLRSPPGRPGLPFGREVWMGQRMGPGAMGPGGGRGPMMRPGGLSERLEKELGLTAAQKEQVGAILGRRRGRLEEIRSDMQGRMQKEQAGLRAEIRGVLDETQQKRFDEVMANTPGLGGMGLELRGTRRGGPGPGGRREN
jgi:hypothetical protein